jgi:drug/metabolite transporter (DMT)-like permease
MIQKIAPLLVALCGILRSTDLYFRNPVVKSFSVITIITWENLINLVIVLPVIVRNYRQYLQMTFRDFVLFLLIGCGASALGILCFTEAFLFINPALAVLLQKLQPLMTIVLGAVFLKEKIGRHFFVWALVAIIASYFVSFGFTSPFAGEWQKIATGSGFAVLAAFFWGGGTIWGKLLLSKYTQLFVMGNRFLFGAIFTLNIAHIWGNGLEMDKIFAGAEPAFNSILYMALISGFVATTFFYTGLKWVKASVASILELFFPISSVVIMWISFNRPLAVEQLLAAMLMFYAIYKINSIERLNVTVEKA